MAEFKNTPLFTDSYASSPMLYFQDGRCMPEAAYDEAMYAIQRARQIETGQITTEGIKFGSASEIVASLRNRTEELGVIA